MSSQILSPENVNTIAVITKEQRALVISDYKREQKEKSALSKAQRSELTINRLTLNSNIKKELLTFENVHLLYIKQSYSFLTSRPTIEKINQNKDSVINELMTQCSDTIAKKVIDEKIIFHFDRLPRLLTDKKLLVSFMTEKQYSDIQNKSFSGTVIVDLLIKALTCNVKLYESGLKKAKTIVLPTNDTKLTIIKK